MMTDNQTTGDSDLRASVMSALAEVRAMSVDELGDQMAAGGEGAEVDSKEAEVVISMLSESLGYELPQVEDLPRGQRLSLDVLTKHLASASAGGEEPKS